MFTVRTSKGKEPELYTKKEFQKIEGDYKREQEHQYDSRQAEKFGILEKYSLNPENKNMYGTRKERWANKFNNVTFKTGGMKAESMQMLKGHLNMVSAYIKEVK